MFTTNTKIICTIVLAAVSIAVTQANDGFNLDVSVNDEAISRKHETNLFDPIFVPGLSIFTRENNYGRDLKTFINNDFTVSSLSLNSHFGYQASFGVNFTDDFAVYDLNGKTILDIDFIDLYSFALPRRNEIVEVDEFTIGIGVEYAYNDLWSIVNEYTQLNNVSFNSLAEIAAVGKISNNQVDHSILSFGVAHQF